MSQVTVRLFAGAAEAFGRPETTVENVADLSGLVTELAAGDARMREILEQCSFFVDDEHHRDLAAALPDRCRVDVLPPFAGG